MIFVNKSLHFWCFFTPYPTPMRFAIRWRTATGW